jgi:hypothetical protein
MVKRVKRERVRLTSEATKRIGKPDSAAAPPVREKKPTPSKGDYAVGRGKPPLHTQFRKGDGRKRPGRKPGSKNLRTIITEAVNDPVMVTIEGKQRKITKLQATAMQLATKAATGDVKAIAKLLDWVDEIEARAEAARPSEYPFNDADAKVIREVYSRLRPYSEWVSD